MIRVGLTGGIGAGKSTVARAFEAFGAAVYYADGRSRVLVGPEDYVGLFGFSDRRRVAELVFGDKHELARLEALAHPRIREDFERWVRGISCDVPYVVMEAAVLFEGGFDAGVDRVVTVEAPVEQRVARAMSRDGVCAERVLERIANQMSREERTSRADFVIDNSDEAAVLPQILRLHEIFSSVPSRGGASRKALCGG